MGLEHSVNNVRTFELLIDGQPEGKGRPKFGANHRVYTPRKTEKAEEAIRAAWRDAGKPRLPDDVALSIRVTLVFQIPATHFKASGELSATGKRRPAPQYTKPDLDNALKLVMDALNKRAWKDDVRFTSAKVNKVWGEWPMTKVEVYALH